MTNSIFSLRSIPGGLSREATETAPNMTTTAHVPVSNTKLITKLIGNIRTNPKLDNMIAVMRAYAEEVKGKFDEDDHAIDIEGDDADLTIYGLVQTTEDDEVYIEYQAMVEMHDPRRFYVGEPSDTIVGAIKSVKMK